MRVSLGGMRDEAEIRGHRRTYIGALPGQVIQGLRRARVEEPGLHPRRDRQARVRLPRRSVVGAARGARSGAEQHVPRSLSRRAVRLCPKCSFITTANVLDPVPPPLRDRMEVLEIAGYTEEEKLQIATDHLVDKQVKNHGLTPEYDPVHARRAASGDSRRIRARPASAISNAKSGRCAGRSRGAAPRATKRRSRSRPDVVVEMLGRAAVPRRGDGGAHEGSGRGDRPGLDAGRRRGAVHRGVEDGRHRIADADRSARRRDEGVGARRVCRGCARTRRSTASIPSSSRTPRCTCTCRRARFPRMGRPPA